MPSLPASGFRERLSSHAIRANHAITPSDLRRPSHAIRVMASKAHHPSHAFPVIPSESPHSSDAIRVTPSESHHPSHAIRVTPSASPRRLPSKPLPPLPRLVLPEKRIRLCAGRGASGHPSHAIRVTPSESHHPSRTIRVMPSEWSESLLCRPRRWCCW